MPEFTLSIQRYDPDAGQAAYWEDFEVDLPETRSVLDGILEARDFQDGSLAIRCSCQAAICGSCGVRINGQSALACNTKLGVAQSQSERARGTGDAAPLAVADRGSGGDGHEGSGQAEGGTRNGQHTNGSQPEANGRAKIIVEPMGNMPVIKDLIVDMDAVHWKKIHRVVPWLLPEGDPPEREYIVPAESMIDITQSMACIQCGACVSACLSMEVDPEFIGPAALAKAYRFVGDPRDAQSEERLRDLAEDEHGIYDCTHCFACIEVCPKDVAPMSQIMRLRRLATGDYEIKDKNNGYGHEKAFVDIIERWGTLHEAQLLPRSFGQGSLVRSQIDPSSISQLTASLPTALRGLKSGKVSPKKALFHPKLPDQDQVKRIFSEVHDGDEERGERLELNLYIVGDEAENAPSEGGEDSAAMGDQSEAGTSSSETVGDRGTDAS